MKCFFKTGFAILICILLILVTQPAAARPPHHHHHHHGDAWGGFAIGLGAGLLGGLLINEYAYAPRYHYYSPPPASGHWEIRNQYVPGTRNWAWEPGHYDEAGVWVRGRWVQAEQGGYWRKERVWVQHY